MNVVSYLQEYQGPSLSGSIQAANVPALSAGGMEDEGEDAVTEKMTVRIRIQISGSTLTPEWRSFSPALFPSVLCIHELYPLCLSCAKF